MERLPITLCVNLCATNERYQQVISTILSQSSCWVDKIAHLKWTGGKDKTFLYSQFDYRDIDHWLRNSGFRVWATHSKTITRDLRADEVVKITSDVKTPYVFILNSEILLPYIGQLDTWIKESITQLEAHPFLMQVGISKELPEYSQWSYDHDKWYWTNEFCQTSMMRTRDWRAAGFVSPLIKATISETVKSLCDWPTPFIRFGPKKISSAQV